jgi:hypothetical protein
MNCFTAETGFDLSGNCVIDYADKSRFWCVAKT